MYRVPSTPSSLRPFSTPSRPARARATPQAVPENGYVSCAANEVLLHMSGGFAVDGELFSADPDLGPVRVQDGGTVDFLRL